MADETLKIDWKKFLSRKFILSLALIAVASTLLYTFRIDFQSWSVACGGFLAIWTGTTVWQKGQKAKFLGEEQDYRLDKWISREFLASVGLIVLATIALFTKNEEGQPLTDFETYSYSVGAFLAIWTSTNTIEKGQQLKARNGNGK